MFVVPSFFGFQDAGKIDPDYKAILDYATTQGYTLPSLSQRILQNKLLNDLKAAGIWAKLDTFAVFATDGNRDFALIDWIRLIDYTGVNTPTFTTNGGFAGDGLSSYIDTNFNPSTQGVNYTLNNAGRYMWVDNRQSGAIWEGNDTTNYNISASRNGTNTVKVNQDAAVTSSAVNFTFDGFKSINRTSATDLVIFRTTAIFNTTATSTSIANSNQFIDRSGPLIGGIYGTTRFRIYGMGASMVSENTAFNDALNTYLTSI
jgi:hypothetical protein